MISRKLDETRRDTVGRLWRTVTVTLQTPRNPWGGVYLFGVTGYPAGDSGVGQPLGYGRIHIYDNDS
ncbi:MAG: DUF2808 domain-containing protein [Nodosilinea sp.]